MVSQVSGLLGEVERERKALNQVASTRLNAPSARASLRKVIEQYFNDVRPRLVDSTSEGAHIQGIDGGMQMLLALCHKRGSVRKYKEALKTIKGHLVQLDNRLVANPRLDTIDRSPIDTRIIATLKALLPSAALSYEQAILDLSQEQRQSWRGPATDLREALRETLDQLAPDNEVTVASGYKQEAGTTGPTMKQKVRFILRSRGLSKAVSSTTEDATTSVDESLGSFVRSVYTRSSVSSHTPTNKSEVLRVLDLVRVVLSELLEIR